MASHPAGAVEGPKALSFWFGEWMAVSDGFQSNVGELGVYKMADLTFLGIENPLGVLGPKFKNVIVDKKSLDRIKSVDKGSDPNGTKIRYI